METSQQQDPRTDGELVGAVNQDDSSAFDLLYYRHRSWVVNLAFRFLHDRELSLDVLQETFVYFAGKFPGFRLTAKLQTFLYPAVRNLALGLRRKSERLEPLSDVAFGSLADPTIPNPGESQSGIFAALAGISEEQRDVLILRFVDGFSLAEVSQAMDVPLGTVKSRLHNALTTLRKDEGTIKLFA